MKPEKKVDWEAAKACLAKLQQYAPSIIAQGVVIGGIACWFYRRRLGEAHDPDFKIPFLSPEQEQAWLSKDIDFTNFFIQDARDLLRDYIANDSQGRPQIVLAGIPIGFAQIGETFDPETAWVDSWIAAFKDGENEIQCRILDPVTLYREKLAPSQKRGTESDKLHLAVLQEYLHLETCRHAKLLLDSKIAEEKSFALKFLISIRDHGPEICNDSRVKRRISEALTNATPPPAERRLIDTLLTA